MIKTNGLLPMFLYVVFIISTIIINICCQLVKLNHLYYNNMITSIIYTISEHTPVNQTKWNKQCPYVCSSCSTRHDLYVQI